MGSTRRLWRSRELAETMELIGAEVDRAWSRVCAVRGAEPGSPQELDLARLVADGPDQFEWRVVDAALNRLTCDDCGERLGSGRRGCLPCDRADGFRYAAREVDRPGVPPGNEHAVRVAWAVASHPHRVRPRAVCGMELGLHLLHAGGLPTKEQAHAYRRMINQLSEAEVERVASLEELEALTACHRDRAGPAPGRRLTPRGSGTPPPAGAR